MKRDEITVTDRIKESMNLAHELMKADSAAIGELVGASGCGKTTASRHILNNSDAKRICCEETMSVTNLKMQVAKVLGINQKLVYTDFTSSVQQVALNYLERNGQRLLLVIDEANKIDWKHLEYIRFLSDECYLSVLLVGTELYERKFKVGRTQELLVQLGRRIGAKRVRFDNMTKETIAAYLIAPRFGKVSAEVVNVFWLHARRGNWGDGVELANTCKRFMASTKKQVVTKDVIESAAQWMANKHAA